MLVKNNPAYGGQAKEQCPHCSHRRKANITIFWLMHSGKEDSIPVSFCDACAARLAQGLIRDVAESLAGEMSTSERHWNN